MSDDAPQHFGALWIRQHRGQLQRRYGVGTFVAVYDLAVIDWGADREAVCQRAAQLVGDDVFVGAVPAEPPDEFTSPEENDRAMVDYRRYRAAAEANPNRRRYPLGFEVYDGVAELDITGQKTEFVDGIVVVDGVERRFSEHDYRLMVEHGLVPQDTELIAGIIFRRQTRNSP